MGPVLGKVNGIEFVFSGVEDDRVTFLHSRVALVHLHDRASIMLSLTVIMFLNEMIFSVVASDDLEWKVFCLKNFRRNSVSASLVLKLELSERRL